jgi:hypothetical protein
MASFTVGQTHLSTDGVLAVDGLQPGIYRFRLEVEDSSGNLSAPVEVAVTVPRPAPPPRETGTVGTVGGIRPPILRVPVEAEPIFRKPINPRIFER